MSRVEVSESPQALADRVAQELVRVLASAGRRCSIALSGGSTPRLLYSRLAQPDLRGQVDWSGVELFFGDERAVPADHPDSNFRMAHEALLRHVPEAIVHRMPAEEGDAEGYQLELVRALPIDAQNVPRLDVVLLGIGSDGHTASLFPGTAALSEWNRLVVMNEVPQLGTRRMTFTFPLINAAREVWVLAAGREKRPVLERVFGDPACPFPIAHVRPRDGELVWWLDREAAP